MAASGFSTSTCRPASRQRLARGKWVDTGVAIATASRGSSSKLVQRADQLEVSVLPPDRLEPRGLASQIGRDLGQRTAGEIADEVRTPVARTDDRRFLSLLMILSRFR